MSRMISRQEAAELLDCNPQTVTNWVEKGFIKGHIIGRALMIDRNSILIPPKKLLNLSNASLTGNVSFKKNSRRLTLASMNSGNPLYIHSQANGVKY